MSQQGGTRKRKEKEKAPSRQASRASSPQRTSGTGRGSTPQSSPERHRRPTGSQLQTGGQTIQLPTLTQPAFGTVRRTTAPLPTSSDFGITQTSQPSGRGSTRPSARIYQSTPVDEVIPLPPIPTTVGSGSEESDKSEGRRSLQHTISQLPSPARANSPQIPISTNTEGEEPQTTRSNPPIPGTPTSQNVIVHSSPVLPSSRVFPTSHTGVTSQIAHDATISSQTVSTV